MLGKTGDALSGTMMGDMADLRLPLLASLWGLCGNPVTSNAGWFGPSNYEECVLEQMKGQSVYLLPTAKAACRAKFPKAQEKPQEADISSGVKYTWCSDAQNTEQLCVLEKPVNYRITKVIGRFSSDPSCSLTPQAPAHDLGSLGGNLRIGPIPYSTGINHWVSVPGEKAYFSETYIFKQKPGWRCATASFYGFLD